MFANPYLTPVEAADLLGAYLGQKAAEEWNAMGELDQSAALFRGMLAIESLPYTGIPLASKQKEAFPRIINGENTGIPDVVKLALALQAAETISEEKSELMAAKRAGVTNYSLDDFSVSFDKTKQSGAEKILGTICESALTLLRPYLMLGGTMDVYE